MDEILSGTHHSRLGVTKFRQNSNEYYWG